MRWRPNGEPQPPGPGTLTATSATWSVHARVVMGLGFVPDGEHRPGARPRCSELAIGDVDLAVLPWLPCARERPREPWSASERALARFATTMEGERNSPPPINP